MAIPSIGKSQASSRKHIKMHEGLRVLSTRSRCYHVLSFSDSALLVRSLLTDARIASTWEMGPPRDSTMPIVTFGNANLPEDSQWITLRRRLASSRLATQNFLNVCSEKICIFKDFCVGPLFQ